MIYTEDLKFMGFIGSEQKSDITAFQISTFFPIKNEKI